MYLGCARGVRGGREEQEAQQQGLPSSALQGELPIARVRGFTCAASTCVAGLRVLRLVSLLLSPHRSAARRTRRRRRRRTPTLTPRESEASRRATRETGTRRSATRFRELLLLLLPCGPAAGWCAGPGSCVWLIGVASSALACLQGRDHDQRAGGHPERQQARQQVRNAHITRTRAHRHTRTCPLLTPHPCVHSSQQSRCVRMCLLLIPVGGQSCSNPPSWLRMLGYAKGELEGKNVSCLMPQPFAGRHNGYLRNYTNTGACVRARARARARVCVCVCVCVRAACRCGRYTRACGHRHGTD
jgi:hypothetical protein